MIYDTSIKEQWCDILPLVQRIMNASEHSSIGCSPASLLFGNAIQLDRGILLPYSHQEYKDEEGKFEPPGSLSQWVERMIHTQRQLIYLAIRTQGSKDTGHLISRADIPTSFATNSYVLAQYPETRMGHIPPSKLNFTWEGPLRVVDHKNQDYTLRNLVTGKLVHVNVNKSS
jgi:hypothetical protein